MNENTAEKINETEEVETKKTAPKTASKKTKRTVKKVSIKKAEKKEKEKIQTAEKPKVVIKKTKGDIRHVLSNSRNGKIQKRLKGTAEGKNKWGHKLGSQAAMIDNLVEAGRFSVGEIRTMTGAGTEGRIYNHFAALKKAGFTVIKKDGKVKFA